MAGYVILFLITNGQDEWKVCFKHCFWLVLDQMGWLGQLVWFPFSKLPWPVFYEAAEVRRRETLQWLQAASKDLPTEEESEEETANSAHQSFKEALYSWTWALRDSGELFPLNEDLCQRWMVSAMYHDLLKQSILMHSNTAPQVFVLNWSYLGLLLNNCLLFVCSCCGKWGRWQNWKDMQPTWNERDSSVRDGLGEHPF